MTHPCRSKMVRMSCEFSDMSRDCSSMWFFMLLGFACSALGPYSSSAQRTAACFALALYRQVRMWSVENGQCSCRAAGVGSCTQPDSPRDRRLQGCTKLTAKLAKFVGKSVGNVSVCFHADSNQDEDLARLARKLPTKTNNQPRRTPLKQSRQLLHVKKMDWICYSFSGGKCTVLACGLQVLHCKVQSDCCLCSFAWFLISSA